MKRRIKKTDMKMAQTVADVIGYLDELTFPENPIKKIAIVRGKPKKGFSRFGYVSKENTNDSIEHYLIFACGLYKELKKDSQKRIVLLRGAEKIDYQSLPKISLEELLVSISAHEVRHRTQYNCPIKLLFSDLETVLNPYIKNLIEYIKLLLEEEPPTGDYNLEFDAKCVEYMAMEMYHYNGKEAISEIASIIRADAHQMNPFNNHLKGGNENFH